MFQRLIFSLFYIIFLTVLAIIIDIVGVSDYREPYTMPDWAQPPHIQPGRPQSLITKTFTHLYASLYVERVYGIRTTREMVLATQLGRSTEGVKKSARDPYPQDHQALAKNVQFSHYFHAGNQPGKSYRKRRAEGEYRDLVS